ncbi:MAG: IS1380 family transposase [Pseudomonadota bacterium]
MTKCTTPTASFPRCKGRQVTAGFDGGEITSDGGALLLRQLDREMGLTRAIARRLDDARASRRCQHRAETMLRQRVFGLALGYEDLNDHHALRRDIALQTAVDTDGVLASQSTLCRFEQQASRQWAVAIQEEIVEQFIRSFRRPPTKRLILDFDATDDPVHGEQLGRHFSGFYDGYCFLPLYVFCGQQLLVSYLRPAYRDAAHHAGAILALLVRRLRQAWPEVKIVFRGDSGFCRPLILDWCERHGVEYIVGLATNSRLETMSLDIRYESAIRWEAARTKQRHFGRIDYAAHSWKRPRRKVVVKAETSHRGFNTRYVVTNLRGSPQWLYDSRYCPRGDMENRIKEQQWLFSDRTSCHEWWPNQYRLLLAGLAYLLLERLRRVYLKRTAFASAQVTTLRLKLLKIGGVVIRNTRRVRLMLSSHYPDQGLFLKLVKKLVSG